MVSWVNDLVTRICKSGNRALHILPGGCPGTYADPNDWLAFPGGAATPTFAGLLDIFERCPGDLRRVAGNQHLVEDHLIQDAEALSFQLHAKPAGMLAQAIDQLLQPFFSKGFEGSPELNRPGAPAHFRCVEHAIASLTVIQVGCSGLHGVHQGFWLFAENYATIIGRVECFVRIHRPRISLFDAQRKEVPGSGRGC